MLIYKTRGGWELDNGKGRKIRAKDGLTTREDLREYLDDIATGAAREMASSELMAPVEGQEIWAAGVTYYRSRTARMAESEVAGGGSFYDRVYTAERPELFFKAMPYRVAGPGEKVRIRKDSKWNVPEPELALLVSPKGKILGYTIGNDMSSRDIEGENPLYLPQAKCYDRSCALGPGILIAPAGLPATTKILLDIRREGESVFADSTTLEAMKRKPEELVEYLFRDNHFPNGCFLLTGTGIIPTDAFTLEHGDEITISIDGIGELKNVVE